MNATELIDGLRDVGNLHEFAELFGFDWTDDSEWTWHDVAVKMADELEQAIAATLGSEREAELQKALNKAAGNWAKADAELRNALDFMRIWISEDAHLGESAISREFEKAEGLRKLDAIEDAITGKLNSRAERTCRDTGENKWHFVCSACGYEQNGYECWNYCQNCGRKGGGRMSEYIIEIPDDYFASYDTERDMYYPDERDSAMPITPFMRCRDCKYFKEEPPDDAGFCTYWVDRAIYHDADGFCAWGERETVNKTGDFVTHGSGGKAVDE